MPFWEVNTRWYADSQPVAPAIHKWAARIFSHQLVIFGWSPLACPKYTAIVRRWWSGFGFMYTPIIIGMTIHPRDKWIVAQQQPRACCCSSLAVYLSAQLDLIHSPSHDLDRDLSTLNHWQYTTWCRPRMREKERLRWRRRRRRRLWWRRKLVFTLYYIVV